jgi:hypothetical protein
MSMEWLDMLSVAIVSGFPRLRKDNKCGIK